MIRFLIAKGANPKQTNRYGSSAMKDAEDTGNAELISAFRWASRSAP